MLVSLFHDNSVDIPTSHGAVNKETHELPCISLHGGLKIHTMVIDAKGWLAYLCAVTHVGVMSFFHFPMRSDWESMRARHKPHASVLRIHIL